MPKSYKSNDICSQQLIRYSDFCKYFLNQHLQSTFTFILLFWTDFDTEPLIF